MSTSDTSGARVRGGGRGKRGTEESVSAPRRNALLIGLSVFLFLALLSPLVATARGSTLSQAQKDLNAAQAALGRFQDSMNVLAAKYATAEARQATLDDAVTAAQKDITKSEKDLVASQQQLADRLVNVYKEGRSPTPMYLEVLFSATDISTVIDRLSMLSKVAGQDQALYAQVQKHLDKRKVLQQDLAKKEKVQSQQLVDLKSLQADMETKMSAASGQYKALKKRVTELKAEAARQAAAAAAAAVAAKKEAKKKPGVQPGSFVFPVDGPHSYADTWGAPRSGGRTHKGCDIMAARGTPLVACVTGTITSLSRADEGLGGRYVWLSGNNGTGYYYCHLDSLASNIERGTHVTAGELLGYVGNTGNAAGGPCHCHFEIHPGEGAAVDPYPTLRAND